MKRVARIGVGVVAALLLSCGMVYAADYNSNPTYCHSESHGMSDFLWWYYECWLPDPPGAPV